MQHNKNIFQYSNIELVDLIKNTNDPDTLKQAKAVLNSRNLNSSQLTQLNIEYETYKRFQQKRKSAPLEPSEWIPLFFLPFFIPKPYWRKDDHFTASEIERFQKYGFEEKAKEAKRVRVLGIIFWCILVFIFVLFYT
ncbi:hypothetical protein [Aquimarina brevivitae]|uniref:Uncharacterized protein n=1 Tax=Aquimarina brevivitae TaxID=323412 RepID=A0A4Q7NYH3_9FLAO|nr:hypothetical protein [Aquimarina brevivitae]RZS92297.1 hypothetical protein EV197_2933 [Aquimarina brevivitae]